jgi:hypothetical protein
MDETRSPDHATAYNLYVKVEVDRQTDEVINVPGTGYCLLRDIKQVKSLFLVN